VNSESGGTRITQELTVEGPQAGDLARSIGPGMEHGVPESMRKLPEAILKAAGTEA